MATLDDKILGEKLHYYCSSSEDEADDAEEKGESNGKRREPVSPVRDNTASASGAFDSWAGSAKNTGPKGVIRDWQRYKQLETERRDEQEKERVALFKRLSVTCRSHLDDEREKAAEEETELLQESEMVEEEAFLREYCHKRMAEMKVAFGGKRRFGQLVELTRESFVSQVEENSTTVVVHVNDGRSTACHKMDRCLHSLAEQYPIVKFCRVWVNDVPLSTTFRRHGCPALLIYRSGEMIGNLIAVTEELGDEFVTADVESLLQEHGLLPDELVQAAAKKVPSDDSDDD